MTRRGPKPRWAILAFMPTMFLLVQKVFQAICKSKNIKGIDVDVYDWDSCKNADKPTVFENKIFNVDTGLISDFGDYADEEKRIIPWEKVSSKTI